MKWLLPILMINLFFFVSCNTEEAMEEPNVLQESGTQENPGASGDPMTAPSDAGSVPGVINDGTDDTAAGVDAGAVGTEIIAGSDVLCTSTTGEKRKYVLKITDKTQEQWECGGEGECTNDIGPTGRCLCACAVEQHQQLSGASEFSRTSDAIVLSTRIGSGHCAQALDQILAQASVINGNNPDLVIPKLAIQNTDTWACERGSDDTNNDADDGTGDDAGTIELSCNGSKNEDKDKEKQA